MLAVVMAASLANAPFIRFNLDVREFGIHGTGTIVVDRLRGRFVRRFDTGPAGDSEGYDGTIVWTADAAGGSYVQGNADTRARGLRWGRIYRTLGASQLPSQIRIRVGADTERTTFADVRCIEQNFCAPFSIAITNQQGTRTIRVRTIEPLQHVDASAFEPPPAPTDARIDAPSGVTSVPFSPERLGARHKRTLPFVVVVASVNGSAPLRFLLDTGGQNILTPRVAKRLGIVPAGTASVGGAGSGTVPYAFAWVKNVRIGDAVMQHQPFMILSLDDLLPDIDGIVGAELLSRFTGRFDFKAGTLSLARTAPQSWLDGTTSPIAFILKVPDMAGSVDGFPGRFTLDTGADGALDINAPFAAKNELYARYHAKPNAEIAGVGGGVRVANITVQKLSLGNSTVANVQSSLAYPAPNSVSDDPTVAGNIGELVLRRWSTMVLNYRALTITLSH
jgi:predicted aspartyl protease